MDYQKNYELWKTDSFFDADTRQELEAITDAKEIEERFYKNLEFGTGGLRGIMGAGTNRMNRYTVGKATKGLGEYLLQKYGEQVCRTRGVAVGYDTRNNSKFFARITADILSGMGIRVYLHAEARPTPQLSFSVRKLDALAGVIVTASHNPKEYNGYKVYDEFGCQLVPEQAKEVTAFVDGVADFRTIDFTGNPQRIEEVELTKEFVDAVLRQSRLSDGRSKQQLHIVYTPLHGTGYIPVCEALKRDGFTKLDIVKEQAVMNGDFPTVVSPNPEDRRALKLGIVQAEKSGADIVLGTDPDSDRIGVAVRTEQGYTLMSGNQIGALLMDYVLRHTDCSAMKKPAVVKTVVTSELGAQIARRQGLSVFTTLTGFKFIGEKITQFEEARERKDALRDFTFVFGYEESYGYLVGTHARDKDAVVSALLIAEMAAEYKREGMTLLDRMNILYEEYGYYYDALNSFTLQGKDGQQRIADMMAQLRNSGSPFDDTAAVVDYSVPVEAEPGFGVLPTSNVLKYILQDGSWIAVRPSGTEPKIKIYYSIKGNGREEAEKRFQALEDLIQTTLQLK